MPREKIAAEKTTLEKDGAENNPRKQQLSREKTAQETIAMGKQTLWKSNATKKAARHKRGHTRDEKTLSSIQIPAVSEHPFCLCILKIYYV